MKRDWIKKVKNNTVVNGIVRLGIGTVLAIAKVCIPVNEKKILFVSFNGLRYDDSPRVLYETIVKDDFLRIMSWFGHLQRKKSIISHVEKR